MLGEPGGQPIRKAQVAARVYDHPEQFASAATDSDGRFRITGLPAGKYELAAARDNYEQAGLGAQRITQIGQVLVLGEGDEKTGIVLHLPQLSSISGRVFDADGDPVVNAEVQVFIEMYPRGTRELIPRGSARTDDHGEYRLDGLQSGAAYYLAARQLDGNRSFSPAFPESREAPAQVFYPGVLDPARARTVRMLPGQNAGGIDVRLVSVRASQLRGRITGIPSEAQGANYYVQVSLTPASSSPAGGQQYAGAGPPEYKFLFHSVAPGRYRLAVELMGQKVHARGFEMVDVTEGMQDEIAVALSAGVSVSGHVRFEGAPGPRRFTVHLIPGDGNAGNGLNSQTDDQGGYSISGVLPGIWDINVTPVPKGGYIKAMTLGKQDVLTEEMLITPSTSDSLNLVVSARGARLEGTVESELPPGSRRALVLVAPTGKFSRVFSFYSARPSEIDGAFQFDGLTPGDYKVYAFDEMTPSAWLNPEFLGKYEAAGVPIKLEEGVTAKANPKLVKTSSQKGENE